jgi:UDP-N-acetylmuramate: L-alanyl-gamma-D-glutamyl-meso-diaminopimelate ligase
MRKNRYYIIGIGGSAMASLAGLLKQKGYEVAGSDQDMYEPMASMLKALKIKVFSPYNAFHMKRYKADVVIVGNAISRGNPEVEHMLSIGQVYRSAPDVLKEEFLERKKNIVVTGTHGYWNMLV